MPRANKALCLAFLLLSAAASAADKVVWMPMAEPPAVIAEGSFSGKGAQELEGLFLSDNLPAFDWRIENARPLRVVHEMETRDGICSLGFIPLPGRERTMIFSRRAFLTPGYGVIVREDRLADLTPYLDGDGAVDLSLLAKAALVGGYVTVRPHADRILQAFLKGESGAVRLVPTSENGSLFAQLIGRRVDFVFGLRAEAAYYASRSSAQVKLLSLPIVGTERWTPAYIGCSNGPVGQKIMAAIDDFLADDRHWAEFIAPWQPWLSAEDYAAILAYHTNPVR